MRRVPVMGASVRLTSSVRPVPARLRKLIARLHPGGAPADILKRHVRGHACLAVQQERQRSALAAASPPVSVTFQPISSMPSRIISATCGGFSIEPTRSFAMPFMVSTPFRSVVVNQVHILGLAGFEAEHHAPLVRDANAPLARAVTLQRMQQEARARRCCPDAPPLSGETGCAGAMAQDLQATARHPANQAKSSCPTGSGCKAPIKVRLKQLFRSLPEDTARWRTVSLRGAERSGRRVPSLIRRRELQAGPLETTRRSTPHKRYYQRPEH